MKKEFALITLFLLAVISGFSQTNSPYISKVYDFRPAPGQFVNKLPAYTAGNTKENIIEKVEASIVGDAKGLVSLGGYGGYIVFGFDHMIENIPGEYDFRVWGNAFYSNANPNPGAGQPGGSNEPGIIMVAYDANGNGEPDEDEWYELAGSEYNKPETIKNYQITYYKPDENKVKVPHPTDMSLTDITYIKWEDNQDADGYIYRNKFHSQSYYPQWLTDETLVFKGTKLADNYVDESGNGSYYVLYAYDWGYADNHPNNSEASKLNIEWAVDENGDPANLPGIHFVKVYTGVNQYCGWIGETSTEIMGAEDLHMSNETSVSAINQDKKTVTLMNNPVEEQLVIASSDTQEVFIYNTLGSKIMVFQLQEGTNYINCQHLSQGIYILASVNQKIKFLKQ